jgi:hypothetical protein
LANFPIQAGFVLNLSGTPHYIISTAEANELTEACEKWVRQVIPTLWPDFDMTSVSPVNTNVVFQPFGPNVRYANHRSRSDLDLALELYQMLKDDDPRKQEVLSVLNEEVAMVASILTAVKADGKAADDNENNSTQADSAESTLTPLSIHEAIRLASENFQEDASNYGLDLTPVVAWSRLVDVIKKWVDESAPLDEASAASLAICQLLAKMFDGTIALPPPSGKKFAEVIRRISPNQDQGDSSDGAPNTFFDLKEILALLVPEFKSET